MHLQSAKDNSMISNPTTTATTVTAAITTMRKPPFSGTI